MKMLLLILCDVLDTPRLQYYKEIPASRYRRNRAHSDLKLVHSQLLELHEP